MQIDLQIGELILEGIPNYQRHQIATAIEQAVTALVAEHGLPPGWQQGVELAALTQQVKANSRPTAIGRQVANAMWGNSGAMAHLLPPSYQNQLGKNTPNWSK